MYHWLRGEIENVCVLDQTKLRMCVCGAYILSLICYPWFPPYLWIPPTAVQKKKKKNLITESSEKQNLNLLHWQLFT